MDGPPIPRGGVLIDGGVVVAVGPAASLPAPPGAREERFDGILLPGLINLHTHLELTGLPLDAPAADFARWIRSLRAAKAERPPSWFAEAATQGVRAGLASGVTTFVDTGDSGAAVAAIRDAGASGIVFQEVFGPHPEQRDESMAQLEARVAALREAARGRVTVGVSPHAPYTVSGPLYRAVADLARREDLPIAVHLAESAAESELVTRGEGAFAEAWRDRGIPPLDPAASGVPDRSRRSPVAWLDAHGVLGPRTLCIHCVRVDPEDIATLRDRGVGVAHCPVSNAEHRHGAAPLAGLIAEGVRVGVGTDSELSVGPLDLFRELRLARTLARLTPLEALALVTTGAARAVGLEARVGRLAPGMDADVVGLDLRPAEGQDPAAAVLAAGPDRVRFTLVAGRFAYRDRHPA